jgi:hypothetical protein
MFIPGIIVLKSLRTGSYLGLIGYFLMLFYHAPALVNTFHRMAAGYIVLQPIRVVLLVLIVALPLATLVRLCLNIKVNSVARA